MTEATRLKIVALMESLGRMPTRDEIVSVVGDALVEYEKYPVSRNCPECFELMNADTVDWDWYCCNCDIKYPMPVVKRNADELAEYLDELSDMETPYCHIFADKALIDFIGDDQVSEAFYGLRRWYE